MSHELVERHVLKVHSAIERITQLDGSDRNAALQVRQELSDRPRQREIRNPEARLGSAGRKRYPGDAVIERLNYTALFEGEDLIRPR